MRIHEAFRDGNLEALRAAVDDPTAIPNGRMPAGIGPCLVYAIYHSPLAFIRALLELGADPNAPADDGFPPLIAALSCSRDVPGAPRRSDVDDLLRLLLSFKADPHQRGINDYTPLHMAVAQRNALAVQRLLDADADPDLRTRIDEYETPLAMARRAGLTDIAAILERRGQPLRQRLRSGLTLLLDIAGEGEPVRRQHVYRVRLITWLDAREPETLITDMLVNRGQIISGLFYGVEGMRVGGTRRLEIAPHLAYGERGVPGVIPPGATLIVEVTILEAAPF